LRGLGYSGLTAHCQHAGNGTQQHSLDDLEMRSPPQ